MRAFFLFPIFLDRLKKIVYFKVNVCSKIHIVFSWGIDQPNYGRLDKRE